MKYFFSLTLFLCSALMSKSQVKIPEGNFTFTFPNNDWKYVSTINNDDLSKVYMFAFSNDEIADSLSPILRIYLEPNSKYETGVDFSLQHYMKNPFTSLDNFTEGKQLPNKNAIGYLGTFTDSKERTYKLLIIDFLHKKCGIQFKFIVAESAYSDFEKEFDSILQSINLK